MCASPLPRSEPYLLVSDVIGWEHFTNSTSSPLLIAVLLPRVTYTMMTGTPKRCTYVDRDLGSDRGLSAATASDGLPDQEEKHAKHVSDPENQNARVRQVASHRAWMIPSYGVLSGGAQTASASLLRCSFPLKRVGGGGPDPGNYLEAQAAPCVHVAYTSDLPQRQQQHRGRDFYKAGRQSNSIDIPKV